MRSSGWLQEFQHVHEAQLRPTEVPRAYQTLTVQGIQHAPFQYLAKKYLANFWELAEAGKAPALLGRVGAYKTYTASVIANAVRKDALIDVAFMQCGAELQDLERRRFDPGSSARLDWLAQVPFLVLDDFTKARPNSFGMDMLDAIVEKRYADGLPTLFTGNVVINRLPNGEIDDGAIVAQFNVGFARRLREMTIGLTKVAK